MPMCRPRMAWTCRASPSPCISQSGPGQYDLAVLVPELRSASVHSVDNSLLLRLPKPVVVKLLVDHPDVAMGVTSTLVRRFQGGGRAPAPTDLR